MTNKNQQLSSPFRVGAKENNNRRDFLKKVALAGAGIALLNKTFSTKNAAAAPPISIGTKTDFILPPLPYEYDALEPYIDKQTMEIHHTKHHQGYVDKLNKALADEKAAINFAIPIAIGTNFGKVELDDICKNVSKYSSVVRNNGGGHYNHSLFWKGMKPNIRVSVRIT